MKKFWITQISTWQFPCDRTENHGVVKEADQERLTEHKVGMCATAMNRSKYKETHINWRVAF